MQARLRRRPEHANHAAAAVCRQRIGRLRAASLAAAIGEPRCMRHTRAMRCVIVVLVLHAALAAADPPAKARDANTYGMHFYAKKDYAHAAEQFRAAIALDDSYVLARYNLASMAALLGDKPTVLAQLVWLRASKDLQAATVLAKARTDPDLKSMRGDADVEKLLAPDAMPCDAACEATERACSAACAPGQERPCGRTCAWDGNVCRGGCAAGMTADATRRMRAWLDGPLVGRDNTIANFRAATIKVDEPLADMLTYTAHVVNQFGFTCALAWSSAGDPAKLSACKAGNPQWTAKQPDIALRCTTDPKKKQEACRGAFTLVSDGFEQDGELVLQRNLK
jgi:hypothetical protein